MMKVKYTEYTSQRWVNQTT